MITASDLRMVQQKHQEQYDALKQRLSEVEAEWDKALRQRVTKREKREFDDLVGDATVLRAYIRDVGETPAMTASNREHWKNRAEAAEQTLSQLRLITDPWQAVHHLDPHQCILGRFHPVDEVEKARHAERLQSLEELTSLRADQERMREALVYIAVNSGDPVMEAVASAAISSPPETGSNQ